MRSSGPRSDGPPGSVRPADLASVGNLNRLAGEVRRLRPVEAAAREVLKHHPYECLCGAGITTARGEAGKEPCTYCAAWTELKNAVEAARESQ